MNSDNAGGGAILETVVEPRVLVVDDEKMVLDVISRIMTRCGFDVTAKEKPIDALDHLTSAPSSVFYDLFVFNYLMPQFTGVKLARKVYDLPRFSDVPVILTSAYPLEEIEDREGERKNFPLNIKDFIQYPLSSSDELREKVEPLMQAQHINRLKQSMRGGLCLDTEDPVKVEAYEGCIAQLVRSLQASHDPNYRAMGDNLTKLKGMFEA